jgi:hypothetical protein
MPAVALGQDPTLDGTSLAVFASANRAHDCGAPISTVRSFRSPAPVSVEQPTPVMEPAFQEPPQTTCPEQASDRPKRPRRERGAEFEDACLTTREETTVVHQSTAMSRQRTGIGQQSASEAHDAPDVSKTTQQASRAELGPTHLRQGTAFPCARPNLGDTTTTTRPWNVPS